MKAKILITGAGGQVGHELAIATTDSEVIALTRAELDITQQAAVVDAAQSQQPDIIINAAAYLVIRGRRFTDSVRDLSDLKVCGYLMVDAYQLIARFK